MLNWRLDPQLAVVVFHYSSQSHHSTIQNQHALKPLCSLPEEFAHLLLFTRQKQIRAHVLLRKKKLKKLKHLTSLENDHRYAKSPRNNHPTCFAPAVVNVSDVNLPSSELKLLKLRKQFTLSPINRKAIIQNLLIFGLATDIRSNRRLNNDNTRTLIRGHQPIGQPIFSSVPHLYLSKTVPIARKSMPC